MTLLLKLKQILESSVSIPTNLDHSEEHKAAFEDCLYACSLGETALEQHIAIWRQCPCASEYLDGVKFVETMWNNLKGA